MKSRGIHGLKDRGGVNRARVGSIEGLEVAKKSGGVVWLAGVLQGAHAEKNN